MTKEGKSKSEIVDYMIARYGNFVTYNPQITLGTAVLWLGPISVLVIGFTVIVLRSRRKAHDAANNVEWNEEQEARLNALLKEEQEERSNHVDVLDLDPITGGDCGGFRHYSV